MPMRCRKTGGGTYRCRAQTAIFGRTAHTWRWVADVSLWGGHAPAADGFKGGFSGGCKNASKDLDGLCIAKPGTVGFYTAH